MGMTRVWNITSDPSTDVPVQNLMVLGKVLKPGQSMQVDEKALEKAHKVTKDVGLKLLAVGKSAPAYLAAGARAELPKDMPRRQAGGAAAEAAETAKVEAALTPAEDAAKPSEEEGSSSFGSRKHRGR